MKKADGREVLNMASTIQVRVEDELRVNQMHYLKIWAQIQQQQLECF